VGPHAASSSVLHVSIGTIEEVVVQVARTQIGEHCEDRMEVDEPDPTLPEVPGPVGVEQGMYVDSESGVITVRL